MKYDYISQHLDSNCIRPSSTYMKLGILAQVRSSCQILDALRIINSRNGAATWPYPSPWQHTIPYYSAATNAARHPKTNRCPMDNAASYYMGCRSSSAGYASLAVYILLDTSLHHTVDSVIKEACTSITMPSRCPLLFTHQNGCTISRSNL